MKCSLATFFLLLLPLCGGLIAADTVGTFRGNGASLTNVGTVVYVRTNWSYRPVANGTNTPSGTLVASATAGDYELSLQVITTNFTSWPAGIVSANWTWTFGGVTRNTDDGVSGLGCVPSGITDADYVSVVRPFTVDNATAINWSINIGTDNYNAAGEAIFLLRRIR